MKFYSEITGELFDTIEELELTEKSIREKEAAEKKANKEIEKAYEEAVRHGKIILSFLKNMEGEKLICQKDCSKILLGLSFRQFCGYGGIGRRMGLK